MATLTTSWANYAKWQWNPGTGFKITFYLDAKYSSQSTANNTTAVQTRLTSVVNSGSGSGSNYKFTCTYCSTVSGSGNWTFASETITSGGSTVSHNNDGTKSLTLKATVKVANAGLSEHTLSATVTLPTIKRYPVISAGQNFTDETDDVTITFTNPSKLYPIRLKLEAGGYDNLIIRDFDKTATSGTITLTETEKQTLRALTPNSKTLTVRETVRAMDGETPLSLSYKDYTMTVVNANPTFTHTIEENNATVISLLGGSSANSIIENISNVHIEVTPTALKSATISSVAVTHNGATQTLTASPYAFDIDVTSDSFTILVTDSRGYTATETITKTLIPYQKVKQNSFSFKRVNPTSSNIAFTLDSLYYQQTFSSTTNAPTIKWRLDDGSWNTLSSSQYTIDTTNNKVTVNTTLNNVLSYMNNGTMYVEVSDLLSTWTNSMNVTKGIPVFEYGEDDVQVNGDLYIADTNRNNKINVGTIINGLKGEIIWTNSNPTNNFAAQTITIPNISEYDMIGVFFFRNDNRDAIFEIKCYNHKNYTSTVGGWYGGGSFSFHEEGTKYVQSRTFWITSQTTIQFNAGYLNTSVDNSRAIPLYIVGYKYNIIS